MESSHGSRSLEFAKPERGRGGVLEYFTVTISAEAVNASRRVYAWGAEGLVRLFAEMAAEWRGWDGTKEWSAVEGDFALSATHNRLGVIVLRASLWRHEPLEWTASVDLALDAGEQLSAAAAGVRGFFAQGHGSEPAE